MRGSSSFKFAFIAATSLGLAACTTFTKKECENMDWAQRGYETAHNGQVMQTGLNYYDINCTQEHGVHPDLALFSGGYKQGLSEVCTSSGGTDLGTRGFSYLGICPKEKEAEFLEGFRRGHSSYLEGEVVQLRETVRELREQNSRLQSDLDSKENVIRSLENQVNSCSR